MFNLKMALSKNKAEVDLLESQKANTNMSTLTSALTLPQVRAKSTVAEQVSAGIEAIINTMNATGKKAADILGTAARELKSTVPHGQSSSDKLQKDWDEMKKGKRIPLRAPQSIPKYLKRSE